jgi:malonyl CoA-acyl carrier protein transacylase
LLDLADDILGEDAFANPETTTRLLQPAIYCASVAGWRRAIEIAKDWRPAAYAGHSLGEIAALACAGVLSPEDGLRLVALRGELMEQMANNGPPGGMLAILGMDFDSVAGLAAHHELNIAGDNAPGQTVVSGDTRILDRLTVVLQERGIDARPLRIKGAFHSPAMEPIRPVFEAAVRRVELREPCFPVFSSVTATPFDDIPHRLAQSLTHPVRWRETMYAPDRCGIRQYVETGLARR